MIGKCTGRSRQWLITALGLSTLASCPPVLAQWRVTNLHPANSAESYAFGIGGGRQVGIALIGGQHHAILWNSAATSFVDLHPSQASGSFAYAISGGSQAGSVVFTGAPKASLWNGTAGSWIDLSRPQFSSSGASAVSGSQQAGTVYTDRNRASVWNGSAASWVNINPTAATNSWVYGASGGQQVGLAFVSGVDRASMWSGTAATWVSLHPAGATSSIALAIGNGQQGGQAVVGGQPHASLWGGTAASWIDLNPLDAVQSEVTAVGGGKQVGHAVLAGGSYRASLWLGTAASWVDLHSYLPVEFSFSFATGVSTEGGITRIVGYGENTVTNRIEALMWTESTDTDSDGDGLLDSWETSGIPYTDTNGVPQRYLLMGANRLHKDLFVEVDAMAGLSLSAGAIPLLEAAFAAAPLPNPDGSTGITLHVDLDQTNLAHVSPWQTDGCWPLDFAAVRAGAYGSPSEHGDSSKLAARAKAYRYCVVADEAGPKNIGGCGQTPGDNFVIFLGSGYDPESQAAVFMHELGHNLGLDHGGGDAINGKPNYPSIMNYTMSYRARWNSSFWRLDYARVGALELADLNESSLDETIGIGVPWGEYRDFKMPFGAFTTMGGPTLRSIHYVQLNGSPTDFGSSVGNGFLDAILSVGVAQDLNYVTVPPLSSGVELPTSASAGQILRPFNDWARVNAGLPLAATLGASAPAPSYPNDELTSEARVWIDQNFPLPPGVCSADMNGANGVTADDIFAFLDAWFAQNGQTGPGFSADFNADQSVTADDIFAFLDAWFAQNGVCGV